MRVDPGLHFGMSSPTVVYRIPSWVEEDVAMLEYLLENYGLTRAQVRSAMRAERASPVTEPPKRGD